MRRVGRSPDPTRRFTLRQGVYAILPHARGILLTGQADIAWDGNAFERAGLEVQLPGGGIDPGEAPVPALHREVYEETGWHIAAPRRLGAFREFVYMPEYDLWAEKICTVYVARPVRPVGPPTDPGHTALILPFGEALAMLANPGSRSFLSRYVPGP
ncbi:MAG: NUDIX hydrolase [Pseudomonadota bacterium]